MNNTIQTNKNYQKFKEILIARYINQWLSFGSVILISNTLQYIRKSIQNMYSISKLLLLLLKKIGNAIPGEGDCHPISPKTPAPHYQPIEEKKRKGK